MFKYERDMIPVLVDQIIRIFDAKYIARELSMGNGIPDLTFAREKKAPYAELGSYESMYFLKKILEIERSEFTIEDISCSSAFSGKKIQGLMTKFCDLNIVKFNGKDSYVKISDFEPAFSEIYAVEAKLKNWQEALFQAKRYKSIAHAVYVAISSEFIHRVQIEEFKTQNVGLIVVSSADIEILNVPETALPRNQEAYFYYAESFHKCISDRAKNSRVVYAASDIPVSGRFSRARHVAEQNLPAALAAVP